MVWSCDVIAISGCKTRDIRRRFGNNWFYSNYKFAISETETRK